MPERVPAMLPRPTPSTARVSTRDNVLFGRRAAWTAREFSALPASPFVFVFIIIYLIYLIYLFIWAII
jgi:hypothetical protein